MTTFSIKDIIKLDPCEEYTREKLEELWEGKESLALREILELTIPIVDRNWVMPRLVPTEIVIKWAHLCAHKAKKHADNAATTADKSTADRVAWYAADAARYADAAKSAAVAAAGSAANAAANAGSAANAAYAANAAAAAGSAAGYAAWFKNRDTELYRLLTILCDMTEE